MNSSLDVIFNEVTRHSLTLADEAQYYWERHEIRYRFMIEKLMMYCPYRPGLRLLDVGMGFETILLRHVYPDADIDCLGVYYDGRFSPGAPHAYFNSDLNLLSSNTTPSISLVCRYDMIVFMEVLEHLIIPPRIALKYLASMLTASGIIFITTPNAAWLKNRLKMLRGKNPFESLRMTQTDFGHIREYTKDELVTEIGLAGLDIVEFSREGIYYFRSVKDQFYSKLSDVLHPSLSRTCAAVCRKGSEADPNGSNFALCP